MFLQNIYCTIRKLWVNSWQLIGKKKKCQVTADVAGHTLHAIVLRYFFSLTHDTPRSPPSLLLLTVPLVTDASCPRPVYKTFRTSLRDNNISQAQLLWHFADVQMASPQSFFLCKILLCQSHMDGWTLGKSMVSMNDRSYESTRLTTAKWIHRTREVNINL